MIKSLLPLKLLLVLSLWSSGGFAQQVFKTTSKSVIGYLEYLPNGYHSNSNDYPLVIFLHGRGEKGPNSTDPKRLKEGERLLAKLGPPMHVRKGTKFPFILISPQLKSNYSGWPTSYVMEVLEHVQKYLRVDKRRIYITGLSMGGFGTWSMIQQYPEIFAAAAPICGGGNPSKAQAIANEDVAVWAFHGDADRIVHYSKSVDMVNAINRYNPNPRAQISIYRGIKHDAWERAYRPDHSVHNPNLYEWFMSQKNNTSEKPENIAPVANAGSDKTITTETDKYVINGSGKDADGSITGYAWTKESGGDIQLSNANSSAVEISGFSEGTYRLKLTVVDNSGAKGSDEVTIKVEKAASPPVANAGADRTIQLPQNTIVLKGEGKAEDGEITGYTWTKVDGGQAELSNEKTPELSVKNMTEGKYRFRLTVHTDKNKSASDEVDVTVRKADPNASPTVNAGKDLTIDTSKESLVLTGSGSDDDGEIKAYKWAQISGDPVTMTGTNSNELTLSEFREGKFAFRLTVTDDDGATASDEVTVTVRSPASPPVADAGKDVVVKLPENTVVLTGKATVENGKISSYKWSKVSGADVTLSGEKTVELQVEGLKEGQYTFRFHAESDNGLSDSDDVRVTVEGPDRNSAPVADAGDDQSVKSSATSLVLHGNATDSDGSIVSYQWTKVSGESVTMEDAETKDLTITGFKSGDYVFRLTVRDNQNATASDDVRVSVSDDVEPPVADAGNDQTLYLPENTTKLDGNGTVESGSIASYKWSKVSGGNVILADTDAPKPEIRDLEQGVYVFRLEVKSDKGLSDVDEVKVTVLPPANRPPVANAGKDVVTTSDVKNVVLEGLGEDEDGTIVSFSWKQISGAEAKLSGSDQPTLTISDLTKGNYVFRLTVTDDRGASASDDILLKVNEKEPEAPVVDAGGDKTITLPVDNLVLQGAADAKGRTIKSFAWTKQSGGTVTMSDRSSPSLKLSDLQEGSYVFRLSATCDNGLTASDEVVVTVKPALVADNDDNNSNNDDSNNNDNEGNDEDGGKNDEDDAGNNGDQPADDNDANHEKTIIADGGDDVTVPANTPEIPLDGKASSDYGDIVSYRWIQIAGAPVVIENGYEPHAIVTGLTPGIVVLELEVRDNTGRAATDQVNIIIEQAEQTGVENPSAEAPQVIAPGDEDPFVNIDLTAGGIPTPEKFGVAVYNDRGDMIFKGRWDEDAFDRVFANPGFYIYHILAGGRRIKAGKIVIQPQ